MNNRGYVWLDESAEHLDQDAARAAALAKKWSGLSSADEERRFQRQFSAEDGLYDYDPYEDCECTVCLGPNGDRTGPDGVELEVGGPNCLYRKADEQAKLEKEEQRRLEVELVEDRLKQLGARMMRPYEHWNEDERIMEYQERER